MCPNSMCISHSLVSPLCTLVSMMPNLKTPKQLIHWPRNAPYESLSLEKDRKGILRFFFHSMKWCSSSSKQTENVSSFWSNSHMAPMLTFETRFLRLAHLFDVFENCFMWLSNDWNNFYATNDHLQQFRADKLSSFSKSEAFTLSPASLIEFIQLWAETLQHIDRFPRPFCLLRLIDKRFLFSVFSYYSCIPFFHFFSSDSQ